MQNLYLLTQTFPLAKGEDTFILPELSFLQEHFNVICVPLEITGKTGYNGNVRYVNPPVYSPLQKLAAIVKIPFQKRSYGELSQLAKVNSNFLKAILYTLFVSYKANLYASFLDKQVFKTKETAIVYSYWFNEICLAAVSLKSKYPQYKFITRTHGYDLFDFRSSSGYQPFKAYMDKRLSMIAFACEMARKYYLERYEKSPCEKYILSYLGVPAHEGDFWHPPINGLNLVSCSNAIPLKRIHLIIKTLSLIDDIPISWSHFGDGETLNDLKSSAKELLAKPNIHYSFHGYTENSKYLEWVMANDIHLFITLSSTEGGVPVSLSEACSLKIPSVATAVGGIPEIITQENGILLPSEPTLQQIKAAITDFYRLSYEEKQKKSDNAYKMWQTKFNSCVNSVDFTQILLNLSKL